MIETLSRFDAGGYIRTDENIAAYLDASAAAVIPRLWRLNFALPEERAA